MMEDTEIDVNIDGQELSDNLAPAEELGKEFIRQWKGAVQTRNNTKIGDYSLPDLLKRLFRARDNTTSCKEQELKELYPEWAALPTSLVDFKTDILKSMIRESIADVARAPFIIDPTPDPELPKDVEADILSSIAESLEAMFMASAVTDDAMEPTEAEMMDMLRQGKLKAKTEQKKYASEQALLLQNHLYDKTVEGGYRKAILEFSDDFALYPLAVLHGPYPTPVKTTVWKDNKFTEVSKVRWQFERVSPFDYFWTEDSVDSHSGTAVFIRKQVPYDFLYNARELARNEPMSGYIAKNLTELIDKAKDSYIPRRWTEFYTDNPESGSKFISTAWQHGDSIEILIRYGRFLGSKLAEMGYTALNPDRSYETKVVMVGGIVIQCELNKNPGEHPRPIFHSSFSRRTGSMVGISVGQRVLPYHEAYRAVIQLAMYNMGLSAEPITEVDYERIAEYMPAEWEKNPTISPGMVIPADPSRLGDNSAAVKFTQIPNITAQALSMAQYIFEQAHVISNIPAALHGQPVGSGANRTVRGLLTLQGNTLKPIKSAMENLDMDVIEPMVLLMYRLLVTHDDEFEYTGDAKIIAKGAATMIEREMEKQTAMENLQILGQLGEGTNPEIIDRATVRLLELSKIIEPGEDIMTKQQAPQMQPNQAAPQPGAAQDPMAGIANPAGVDMQSIPGAI